MATQFAVDLVFKSQGLGKLDQATKKLQGLDSAASNAANGIRPIGGAAKSAAAGVRGLGAAFKAALGPIGLALSAIGGLSAAFGTLSKQNFAEAKFRSLGGSSKELVTELKAVSKELKGQASVVELTSAAYDVASAGFSKAADTAKVLKAASLGATGGFSDINTVANATTSVLNAYGKSASEAGKLVDGFIQTQNDGKIVVAEYAANIGKVASAAAGLKVPMAEVNAIIAQSTAAGVQSEVAFTGLKGALARLASGEAEKALQGTGIQINAATIEADGLLGTLKKLQGLDTGQIFKALGTEAGPALLPVIQNLEKFEQLIENQKNSAGASAKAQATAANTIQGAWKSVQTAVENAFSNQSELAVVVIGSLKVVRVTVEAIAGVFELVGGTVRGVVAAFQEVGKALGVKPLADAKKLEEYWQGVLGVVSKAAAAFTAIGRIIGKVIGGAIKIVVEFYKEVINAFVGPVQKIGEVWQGFVNFFGESVDKIGQFWTEGTQQIQDQWGGIAQNILNVANGLWQGISDGAGKIVGFIGNAFKDAFAAAWEQIKAFYNALPAWLRGALEAAGSVAGAIGGAIGNAFGKVVELGKGVASDLGKVFNPPAVQAAASTQQRQQQLSQPQNVVVPTGGGLGGSGGGGGSGKSASASAFKPSSRAKALIAAAKKLGVSPLDLATIVSYETAGTFSPSIYGGAGGNYMGLIQFGGPERQQYGAHAGQSFEEQIQGPVVRFFQDRFGGVGRSTQGASLLDLYKTVNGGNPNVSAGLSDGNGTIGGHVQNMMGGHRQKALSTFFGGSEANVGYDMAQAGSDAAAGWADVATNIENAKKALEGITQSQVKQTTTLQQQLEFEQQRQQLLSTGQNMQQIERELALKQELQGIELQRMESMAQLVEIAGSNLLKDEEIKTKEQEITAEFEKQKALLEELHGLRNSNADAASARAQSEKSVTNSQANSDAQGLASTISGGLRNAITTAIQGGDVKQVFEQLASSLADKFLEMAFRPLEAALENLFMGMFQAMDPSILATTINTAAINANTAALQAAAAGGGGGGGGFNLGGLGGLFSPGGSISNFGTSFGQSFAGGFGPEAFNLAGFFANGGQIPAGSYGVVGEAGPELAFNRGGHTEIVPMNRAMSRYSPGGGGSGGGSGGGHFTLDTVVINNVEYATVDQVRSMGQQAARQGAENGNAKTMKSLQHSRAQRSRLGMR